MKKQPASTGKKRGKRAELEAWLAREQPAQIDEAVFEGMRRDLAPVSENYLRKLLRESGAPMSAMAEGVRQSNFGELEASLLRLLEEFERGDPWQRARVRQIVVTAKDHARWAARNPGHGAEKEEMALWMLTWLENPPIFPEWVKLRRAALGDVSVP